MAISASGRPLEILLIEDNLGDVRLTVEVLRQSRLLHRLHVVEDGQAALAFLRREGLHEHEMRPDLILLDINLPRMSGLELLEIIKSDRELMRIPVIMLTTSMDPADVTSAYSNYANCYIRKPVELDQFFQMMQGLENFWLSVVCLPTNAMEPVGRAINLLLVEDDPAQARLTSELLIAHGHSHFEVCHVETLARALQQLREHSYDAVLLDLSLPDSKGIETVTAVHLAAPQLPIVVHSGFSDEEVALLAIQRGAQDYVVKGSVDGAMLRRTLRHAIERNLVQDRLDHLATHDHLTGLPNRELFLDHLSQSLIRARRNSQDLAVLCIGFTQLGLINQSHGHVVGDLVLRAAARRVQSCLREDDRVARTGGSEFAVVLSDARGPAGAPRLAAQIVDAARLPIQVGDQEFFLGAGVGVSSFPEDGDGAATLLKNADTALYQAKKQGSHAFQFFSSQMHTRVFEHLSLERELRHVLERGELRLDYQPIYRLKGDQLNGLEVLVRWKHPQRGVLLPESFLRVAEESDLIVKLGEWVLENACRDAVSWGMATPMHISVNVSARQLALSDFVAMVDETLRTSGLPAQCLELELTETVLQQPESASVFAQLRDLGVSIAIDDFGTGYSSLRYLKNFPVDVLKIDKSFIDNVDSDPRDAAIVKTIIGMAHNLGIAVVAEGVETTAQLAYLRAQRCDLVQGFLLSRPLNAERVPAFLGRLHLPMVARS